MVITHVENLIEGQTYQVEHRLRYAKHTQTYIGEFISLKTVNGYLVLVFKDSDGTDKIIFFSKIKSITKC